MLMRHISTVEFRPLEPTVAGSNPAASTKKRTRVRMGRGLMKATICFLLVASILMSACVEEQPSCAGREKVLMEKWSECMKTIEGDPDRVGHGMAKCWDFAMSLACADGSAYVPVPRKAPKLTAEKIPAKVTPVKDSDSCAEAKRDQQELRFWKRCGVVDPGNYDQWANCDGHEHAIDSNCNPRYGDDKSMCFGDSRSHWERMKRDGVKWINCKDGEICE